MAQKDIISIRPYPTIPNIQLVQILHAWKTVVFGSSMWLDVHTYFSSLLYKNTVIAKILSPSPTFCILTYLFHLVYDFLGVITITSIVFCLHCVLKVSQMELTCSLTWFFFICCGPLDPFCISSKEKNPFHMIYLSQVSHRYRCMFTQQRSPEFGHWWTPRTSNKAPLLFLLCPRDWRSRGILFLSCLSFCHSVILSSSLKF